MNSSNNQQQRGLNQCDQSGSLPLDVNLDQSPPYCNPNLDPNNKRSVNGDDLSFLKDIGMQKTGFGAKNDCDPMQRGVIVNDLENPERNVLYRYSRSIRGTDEAMLDMFNNVVVLDEDGKAWPIPIILGPPEKAVAAIVQDNVHKDETLVVDRLKLPLLALSQGNIDYDLNRYTYHKALNYFNDSNNKPGITVSEKYSRDTVFGSARGIPINISYTLTAWTMYREDMNQILEQILSKFSQIAYIRVVGVPWEVIVKLDSVANNLENEPGDQAVRVIKYEFNLQVETYIPQPIERKKSVLKVKIDLIDGLSENEVTEVMARIEESVKELQC